MAVYADTEKRKEYMREYMKNSKWNRIGTMVTDDEKAAIEEYISKHELKNMSEFVRICIHSYMEEHQ